MPTRGRAEIRHMILLVPVVLLVLSGGGAIARAVTFFRAFGGDRTIDLLPGMSDVAKSMMIAAGVLALMLGLVELFVSFGLATHRSWARTSGIVVALISAFFAIPVLSRPAGLLAFVVDLVIVAILAWDAMTDYPEEAVGPTWGEFGRGPTDSRNADPPAAN